ncbi:long tail fiber protein proximal connector [Acinetobacter phage 133]|uniref:Gp35 hinge connector of long tail fiber proximal connector n=1 Tax=Acinetobacter phage 133 TaxID=2919552 RepID=D9I6I0_9CAUD|nr:long tail fiber protein proximal connector [Acinetobacter phage 133]ADJ19561.1 gp35 hinge connector of long tail fiber proximal connector [Acinetobacter phage 133]
MAQHLMASLNDERVQVQTVSESNSVAFKLNVAGVTRHSSPQVPYVMLNDTPLGVQTFGNGINVRVLGANNTILDRKEFQTTNVDGTVNSAFVSYMNAITGIAIISSGPNMKASPAIDAWFSQSYSIAWPGAFICNNYDVAYVATYSGASKRIVMEANLCDDGTDKGRATIETVYDSLSDIGATGFAYKAIYDPTEYSSESLYELKRYPVDNVLISPFNEYGIVPGTNMLLSCELFASQSLIQAGMTTRLNLRWYNGSTLVDAKSFEVNALTPDKWIKFDEYVKVPLNANGFTIVVSRYPRNNAIAARAAVRSLVFNLVSGPDELSTDAAIGVNGIKTSNFIQGTESSKRIMNLPDSTTTPRNFVSLNDVHELPLTY